MFKSFLRGDKLLILRGLACLAVVIQHAGPPRDFLYVSGRDLSWFMWVNAGSAVSIFFVLSGYLMGKAFFANRYSLSFSGVKKFYIARAMRLLPLYYFVVLTLALFYNGSFIDVQNWKSIVKLLTFSYNHTDLNTAFWTLAVEVQFYLLVPLLFWIFQSNIKRRLLSIICLLVVFVFGVFQRLVPEFWLFTPAIIRNSNLAHNLDIFVCGFLLYPILSHYKNLNTLCKNYIWAVIPLSFVFLLGDSYLHYNEVSQSRIIQHTLLISSSIATGFALIYIYLVESQEYLKTPEKNHRTPHDKPKTTVLEWVGKLSFGIYVWHFPILAAVGTRYPAMNGEVYPYFRKLGITLILSVLYAFVTHIAIENYFVKKRNTVKA